MKRPNIAMNVSSQRRITNELIVLEWLVFILLFMMFVFGTKMRATEPQPPFFCTIPSLIAETPEWMVSLGKQFHTFGMVLIQMFIVVELIMYIILFKDLYDHNKELQNGNSLGSVMRVVKS